MAIDGAVAGHECSCTKCGIFLIVLPVAGKSLLSFTKSNFVLTIGTFANLWMPPICYGSKGNKGASPPERCIKVFYFV
jgi:hypothetical protein